MKHPLPPVPAEGAVLIGPDDQTGPPGGRSLATRDREVIQPWADRHSAEPALDDLRAAPADTAAEPVRFNFPGVNRYRPVPWDEWFAVFQEHRLVFVYEEDVSDRAYELWRNRPPKHGQAREDWFTAQRQLQEEGARPSGGYRFVKETVEA